jgi:hypothetical protein
VEARIAREPLRVLAGASALVASTLALATPLLGAAARPGYSHCAQYISELGERGATHAAWVNFAGFLPIGAFTVLFAVLAACAVEGRRARSGLLLFSGVGWAYAIAAFFPCDPGCPSPGSTTQQIHSSGALLEYAGGAVGLLFAGDARVNGAALAPRWLACIAGAIALGAFAAMLSPALAPQRGLVQRVAELALFGWLALAGRALWTARPREESASPAATQPAR